MSFPRLTLWLLLAVALGAGWFFGGTNPVQLIRQFVGRGRKLSQTTMNNGRDIDQTVDEVVAQVREAMGRDVAKDAVILARVSANEHPGAAEREKAAIQWVCKNDADANGWSLEFTTTTARGCWGTQPGRRYATHGEDMSKFPGVAKICAFYEIHEDDLFVAESILAGQIPDFTGGARRFIHYTGFHRLADFLTAKPKVQAWVDAGWQPVELGDVSTLVVFTPPSESA